MTDAAARRAADWIYGAHPGYEDRKREIAEWTTREYADAMEALEERIQAACAYECSAAPGQREHTPGCVKARAALARVRGE